MSLIFSVLAMLSLKMSSALPLPRPMLMRSMRSWTRDHNNIRLAAVVRQRKGRGLAVGRRCGLRAVCDESDVLLGDPDP